MDNFNAWKQDARVGQEDAQPPDGYVLVCLPFTPPTDNPYLFIKAEHYPLFKSWRQMWLSQRTHRRPA